jgi:hypothetical protein
LDRPILIAMIHVECKYSSDFIWLVCIDICAIIRKLDFVYVSKSRKAANELFSVDLWISVFAVPRTILLVGMRCFTKENGVCLVCGFIKQHGAVHALIRADHIFCAGHFR